MLPIIAALAVAIGAAGCGGSGDKTPTVPSTVADDLLGPLNAAQEAQAAGQCDDVQADASAFLDKVNGLGKDAVDPDIKTNLQDAGASLKRLAETDCVQVTTGLSGAQGSTEPKDQATADANATTSTEGTTTSPGVAAKPPKPDKGKKSSAKAVAKPDPAAGPVAAKPAKPTEPTKTPGKNEKPKKDKGPKKNGPPGSAGTPNDTGNASGGVTPSQDGG